MQYEMRWETDNRWAESKAILIIIFITEYLIKYPLINYKLLNISQWLKDYPLL